MCIYLHVGYVKVCIYLRAGYVKVCIYLHAGYVNCKSVHIFTLNECKSAYICMQGM